MATGERMSADPSGSTDHLDGSVLCRALGTAGEFPGPFKEVTLQSYLIDSTGEALDGSRDCYRLRFPPGELPPVQSFWSLTMYELPSRLLVRNPLSRYLINSSMLP